MTRRSIINQLALFFVLQNLVSSYRSHGFRSRAVRPTTLHASSTVGRAEWTDDESLSREVSSRRKLNGTFIESLDGAIGSLITRCALSTVSYYMLEFHDEVNEKWMMGFGNYRKSGQFPGGLWTNYIEKMIMTDKQQVEVLMTATKASLRARKIPEGGNIMMQYFHDLEPRKIAHQIITVREDVSGEMIQDLGCVKLENEEATRFAYTWAREGIAVAEKSRKITRMRGEGDSTPVRDGNYMDFDVMITTLAMQLVRDDLVRSKDTLALQVMDDLTIKMSTDDDSRTMLERVLHDTQGPRSYMEQLYHKGITDGVVKSGGKTVNILKVAENLFDTRLAIAKEASKLLSMQSLQNRHYYKMIKDYGGFQKLDLSSGVPVMRFVNLDTQALEDAKEAAEEALELSNEALKAKLEVKVEVKEVAPVEELVADDYDTGSSGPMMM